MAIDLQAWMPPKLLTVYQDPAGHTVDEEQWNGEWNRHRYQGDDTAQALYESLQKLYATVWHAEDGATPVAHPAPAVFIPDDTPAAANVGSQLDWLTLKAKTIYDYAVLIDEDVQTRREKSVAITHDETTDRDATDCHPMSAITGLVAALEGIQAGELAAVAHNLLPDRDVADAHPITAITGLPDIVNALSALEDSYLVHTHDSIEITHGATTVAAKLNSIDATIASITGDIGEITHNDLAGRDAASAHPISAITGLQTALDAKLATTTAASTYQPQILHGTTVPDNASGNDGDVYIRIS